MIPFEGVFLLRNEEDVQAFYVRWVAPVLCLCRLFVGDEARAQQATIEAFLAYLRAEGALDGVRIPTVLLSAAVHAIRCKHVMRRIRTTDDQPLANAILALPSEERMIFILRYVLRLNPSTISSVTGVSEEAVRKMSFQSLLKIRELLPRTLLRSK